jgi:hypothetical protein
MWNLACRYGDWGVTIWMTPITPFLLLLTPWRRESSFSLTVLFEERETHFYICGSSSSLCCYTSSLRNISSCFLLWCEINQFHEQQYNARILGESYLFYRLQFELHFGFFPAYYRFIQWIRLETKLCAVIWHKLFFGQRILSETIDGHTKKERMLFLFFHFSLV